MPAGMVLVDVDAGGAVVDVFILVADEVDADVTGVGFAVVGGRLGKRSAVVDRSAGRENDAAVLGGTMGGGLGGPRLDVVVVDTVLVDAVTELRDVLVEALAGRACLCWLEHAPRTAIAANAKTPLLNIR